MRVNVKVNDEGIRRKRRELSRDAIVEARADCHQKVTLIQGPVRVLRAMHTRGSEAERIRVREGSLRHERSDDRKPSCLCEGAEFGTGIRVNHSAAHVEHRPARIAERLRRTSKTRSVDFVSTGSWRSSLTPPRVNLSFLDITRNVDEDRPAWACERNRECFPDHVLYFGCALNKPRPLHKRCRDRRDVALLKSVRAD